MRILAFIFAFIIGGFGILLTVSNFYLSFLRYPIHKRFYSNEEYHFVSGVPLIGSGLLWICALIFMLVQSSTLVLATIVISLFDTGGTHWFPVVLIVMYVQKRKRS